jgi:cyclophilin family peptidyl-prolyl cis-trans isomerase
MTARARDGVGRLAAVHPQVVSLAEQIYAASPEADPRAALVLKASCEGLFVADDYEPSLRLARLLVDRGAKEKNLYLLGGIAALYVGDLDTAKDYLAAAVQQGARLDSGLEGLDPTIVAFHKDPRTYEEAWRKEQEIRAREAQANDLPRVLLKTNRGDVEIELFENEAPNTVANFITLVDKGYYNGLSFHRVLPGFMAQGGCPKGDGSGGPGYDIACECHQPNYRKHFRGSLSMAHAGRDTGGSQFFITLIPTTHLDGMHTVFGRVIQGMDVLAKIQRRDPADLKEGLGPPDEIVEAKVLRKRDHRYEVKKVGE